MIRPLLSVVTISSVLHCLILSTQTTTAFTSSTTIKCSSSVSNSGSSSLPGDKKYIFSAEKKKKGRLLVLGGSGFLGLNVARRASLEGYAVTSLSRRGKMINDDSSYSNSVPDIDYRKGDARDASVIADILSEGGFVAVAHCIGLLFDSSSRLASFNRLVSGSGSIPDDNATYDDITRLTAFRAIEEVEKYVAASQQQSGISSNFVFLFTSAAEANWPNVNGGAFVERNLTPNWLKRYLKAKRDVEERLMSGGSKNIRTVIFRPSLIYSLEKTKIPSLPAVFGFFVGNRLGLPFVDRPVTVQRLSLAMVRAIGDDNVQGALGYKEIDDLVK